MVNYYGTVSGVKRLLHIQPDDVGITDSDSSIASTKLDEYLVSLLSACTDIINNDRKRNYNEDVLSGLIPNVPLGIGFICEELVSEMLKEAMYNRGTTNVNIVNKDDKIIVVNNSAAMKRLKSYPKRNRVV